MASLRIMANQPGGEHSRDADATGLVVAHDPTSAAVARRAVAGVLASARWPEESIADAELLVSELIGNAVRHAQPLPGGVLRVQWELGDDRVVVRVMDGGGAGRKRPHRRLTSTDATSGRGLGIVAALADAWGVDAHPRGQSVWAVLRSL